MGHFEIMSSLKGLASLQRRWLKPAKGWTCLSCCAAALGLCVMTLPSEWVCWGGHWECWRYFHTLRSLVVPHRAGGVSTGSSGVRGSWGSNGLMKSVREGEQHLAEENWQHKTIDCLIHGGRGMSFNAVNGGSPLCDQSMRTIVDSRYPGSVTEGQEKEPVLQPAYFQASSP